MKKYLFLLLVILFTSTSNYAQTKVYTKVTTVINGSKSENRLKISMNYNKNTNTIVLTDLNNPKKKLVIKIGDSFKSKKGTIFYNAKVGKDDSFIRFNTESLSIYDNKRMTVIKYE